MIHLFKILFMLAIATSQGAFAASTFPEELNSNNPSSRTAPLQTHPRKSANTRVEKSLKPRPSPPGRWNISVLYNTADHVNYGGYVDLLNGTQRFAMTSPSTGQFGVGVSYTYLRSGGFGFGLDMIYEMPRPISTVKGSAGNLQINASVDGAQNISLGTLNATLNYSFGDAAYIFGGVNTPYPTGPTSADTKLTGLVGYNAGAGFVISDRFTLEAAYRLTAFKGSLVNSNMQFDVKEADIVGFLLQLRYRFH